MDTDLDIVAACILCETPILRRDLHICIGNAEHVQCHERESICALCGQSIPLSELFICDGEKEHQGCHDEDPYDEEDDVRP